MLNMEQTEFANMQFLKSYCTHIAQIEKFKIHKNKINVNKNPNPLYFQPFDVNFKSYPFPQNNAF